MNLNNLSNWVNIVAFAVWPIVMFVGRRVYRHLTDVERELHDSDGSSMRDAIARIEDALEALQADTKKNTRQLKALRGDIETLTNSGD